MTPKYDKNNFNGDTSPGGRRPTKSDSVVRSEDAAPTCFMCLGEGRTEHEYEYLPHSVTLSFETCPVCGGSGVIDKAELYECQGRQCGVLVTGPTLVAMQKEGIRCQCNAPAIRFCFLSRQDLYYPKTADDYHEAVWTLEDLKERRDNENK